MVSRSRRASIAALVDDPRELERGRRAHEERLANVKASIDNKPPAQYPHIRRNAKREMARADEKQAITQANTPPHLPYQTPSRSQGNARLTRTITKVKSFSSRDAASDAAPPMKLSASKKDLKKREEDAERERENLILSRRLENTKSYYSCKDMEKEAKEREIIRQRLERKTQTPSRK